MKKTATIILLTMVSAALSHAQTAYDAWKFSGNNYEGTARSVAMGNAFTALGGDLGAVSINPAGSAVAGYSQFALTPSITIAGSTAGGVLPPSGGSLPYFDRTFRSTTAKAGIPNVGFTCNFDTGRKNGLKNVTIGFVLNKTNDYTEDVYAKGTNSTTSFAAAAAYEATENIAWYNANLPASEPRYSYKDFLSEDAYDYYSPWKDITGYRGGLFSHFGTSGEDFIGATEILYDNGSLQQAGPLMQTLGRSVYGNKYEYLFNIGMNISDFVYIGANLGINSLAYDSTEYFKEAAVDSDDFENIFTDDNGVEHTAYFRDMLYRYSYSATGTGVFGKFGIIVTPGGGLRIGAAIQTPTANTIREEWQELAETNFTNSQFSGSAESPLGTYEYRFRSPLRANFGLAWTFGRFGVISADYEIADYGSMRFKYDRHNDTNADIDFFEALNDEIKEIYGTAHHLRLGLEVKPLGALALRAGYNLSTTGEKFQDTPLSHNVSFGLGYSSKGSFFADLACRHNFATKEYYMPYIDYQYNDLGEIVNYSPEILIKHSAWKVHLTLGWRF